jgi:hypothetical protein
LIKHIKIIFIILVFPILVMAQNSINTGIKDNRPKELFYKPNGGTRIILGLSGVYGAHYGLSAFIAQKWSVELAHGRNMDINIGGGKYDMKLYGVALNRYFLIEREMAIVTSILYSYANVTQRSSEYTGDFSSLSPMVGIDYSAKSGFGYFLRGGLILTTRNYLNGSGKLKADLGICWRFDLF